MQEWDVQEVPIATATVVMESDGIREKEKCDKGRG